MHRLSNWFVTDCNLKVSCSEIAAMVPMSLGGGRGNVYNMVLHNPNYVNTLMQYSFAQVCLEVTSTINYFPLVALSAFKQVNETCTTITFSIYLYSTYSSS